MSRCPICGMTDGFHTDDPMVLLGRNGIQVAYYMGHREARREVDPQYFLSRRRAQ